MTDDRLIILKGALDILILKAMSWGPMHGYGVSCCIRHVTEDVFDLQEGALYPALHRLESKEWIESEWGLSDNNRRAKYYELTSLGRASNCATSCRCGRGMPTPWPRSSRRPRSRPGFGDRWHASSRCGGGT